MPVFVRQDGEWIDTAGTSEVGVGESYWVSTLSGIHTTSNVGIGTTDPQYQLDVNGNARISDLKITGTQIIGIDHTEPVIISVPDSITTTTIPVDINISPSDSNNTTNLISIDSYVYPWSRYLNVGDTVAVSDGVSEVININIINISIAGIFGNLVEVLLETSITYSDGDNLIFSYRPRSEWRFNSNSSATFPGNLGVGLGTGINSIINVPSPTEKLVVGGNVFIKDNGLTQYPQLYPYGGGVLYGSEIDILTQTTDPVGIHSRFSIGEYRSVDYTIISNAEQVVKISTIYTGSNIYSEVYSAVNSGIATFAVDISGGNIRLVAIASTSTLMSHIVNYVATRITNYPAT